VTNAVDGRACATCSMTNAPGAVRCLGCGARPPHGRFRNEDGSPSFAEVSALGSGKAFYEKLARAKRIRDLAEIERALHAGTRLIAWGIALASAVLSLVWRPWWWAVALAVVVGVSSRVAFFLVVIRPWQRRTAASLDADVHAYVKAGRIA
jgi:hypothetical protein